ncbi:uncharacterized protein LOC126843373 isoform X1 [Adelges cooleyi]|uniref:uncharacterized protein LOC126843373 isoform X1 n=1 Tax=Adelges cooleyi TaxID=133065 RepID=UPI00218034C0|nr:uncharacterized protein LOC126843373 isoform X1 [Adelges cooleyi]
MKLLCILISFTLVNVLVAELDEYVAMVKIVNNRINDVKDPLPEIITNIVRASQKYTMRDISNMLVVPESIADTSGQMLLCQYYVLSEISHVESSDTSTTKSKDQFKGKTLLELGEKRRDVIGKAVKNVIEGVLAGDNQDFKDSLPMCRLLGFLRSIKFPDNFVVQATVKDKICILEDININVISYKHQSNNYWQIAKNSSDGAKLSELLKGL